MKTYVSTSSVAELMWNALQTAGRHLCLETMGNGGGRKSQSRQRSKPMRSLGILVIYFMSQPPQSIRSCGYCSVVVLQLCGEERQLGADVPPNKSLEQTREG
jgi:hypothetical protein